MGTSTPIRATPTATPWGPLSLHATHVAGIMAGRNGTYNYTSGPAPFPLQFSGMAPGAYVMSYRLDGDSAEFLAAIDDVVADEADALNISLGHSRWLTTDPEHDPIRDALDAAVDAGVDRRRVVRKRRRERRHEHHGLLEAEPEGHHRREQHARARVLERGLRDRPRHAAGVADRAGPASRPAHRRRRSRSTISGEYVVAPGGIDGQRRRGLHGPARREHDGQDRARRRGTCTFEIKKNNVMAAGATA